MERPSKTRKKQEALSAQDLGEKLVNMPEEQLKQVPLPENVHEAVMLARRITKHGGRKRQLQYIGTLMRKTDSVPIRDAVQVLEEGDRRQVELHQQAEEWRDALINGNDELLRELAGRLPEEERQQLTELVSKARNERLKKDPSPTPARVLFRFLYRSVKS